jgi:hypothetical protein
MELKSRGRIMHEEIKSHTGLLQGNKKLKGVKNYYFEWDKGYGEPPKTGLSEKDVYALLVEREMVFDFTHKSAAGYYWIMKESGSGPTLSDLRVHFETYEAITHKEALKYYDALFEGLIVACKNIKRTKF